MASHERPGGLGELLAALRSQTLPSERFEVIVVDDGSGDATRAVLEQEASRGVLRLRTRHHDRPRGPAAARNSGWRMAAAPLVAFTDDDCVPAPTWLLAGVGAAAAHPAAIIQGRTEPASPLAGLTARSISIDSLTPSFETCNVFYPRRLLDSLGGFDEAFGPELGGEDTELAWRAIDGGGRVVFEPEALVRHAVIERGLVGSLRDAMRWAGIARVVARHPGAREILHARVFWNVWHYLLVRSVLALLGPRWLRQLVLRRHLRALRRRSRALDAGNWGMAYLVLYDAIETLAIARGAILNRTLVL